MSSGPSFEALVSDPFLASFFDEHFDEGAYVRSIVRQEASTSTVDETPAEQALSAVRLRCADVDGAIRRLVTTHQDALFAQAAQSLKMRDAVADVHGKAAGMQETVDRMHKDFVVPLQSIKRDTTALRQAVATADLLRDAQKALAAGRKLRGIVATIQSASGSGGSSSGPSTDGGLADVPSADAVLVGRHMSRVGPVLAELRRWHADPRLTGVTALAKERKWVAAVAATVRTASVTLCTKASDTLNSSDVGVSLSALHDLGCLPVETAAALDRIATALAAAVRDAVDPRQVAAAAATVLDGGSGADGLGMGLTGVARPGVTSRGGAAVAPPPGAAAAWRGVVWGRMEAMCEAILRSLLQAWNIVHVLQQSPDSSRRALLISHVAAALQHHSSSSSSSSSGEGIQPHPAEEKAAAEAAAAAESGAAHSGGSGASPLPAATASSRLASHAAVRLLRRAWLAITDAVRTEIEAVCNSDPNGFVRTTLMEGYPRLHYALRDVLSRAAAAVASRAAEHEGATAATPAPLLAHAHAHAHAATGAAAPPPVPAVSPISGAALFAAATSLPRAMWMVAPLQRLYLARSLSRMTEGLAAMFPPTAASAAAAAAERARMAAAARRAASASGSGSGSGGMGGGGSGSGLPAAVTGFTPAAEMDSYLDESYPPPPSAAAASGFIRTLQLELQAARPGLHVGSTGSSSSSAAAAAAASAGLMDDAGLYAAVAKGVSTALKLLVAKVEAAAAVGPSATAVAAHWMPTPAQSLNAGLVSRLEEVRIAILKAAADLPLLPPYDRLLSLDASDPVLKAAAAERAASSPLSPPLPPHLLAVYLGVQRAAAAAAASGANSKTSANASAVSISSTAQGQLLTALLGVDRCIDSLLLPWLASCAAPLERCVMRVHEQTYTALVTTTTTSSSSSSGGAELAAGPGESEWLTTLESHASGCAAHQLPLLPKGALFEAVRKALAARICRFFVAQVCLLRPIDDSGRLRLTRDCTQLEIAVAPLCGSATALGSSYAQLRALRPLLFATTPEIAAALEVALRLPHGSIGAAPATAAAAVEGEADAAAAAARSRLAASLIAVGAANLLHALLARLPRECALPHTHGKMTLRQYADALDAAAAADGSAGAAEGTGADSSSSGGSSSAAGLQLSRVRLFPPPSAAVRVDRAVWSRVLGCLEAYATRLPATTTSSSTTAAAGGAGAEEYRLLTAHGARIAEQLSTATIPSS